MNLQTTFLKSTTNLKQCKNAIKKGLILVFVISLTACSSDDEGADSSDGFSDGVLNEVIEIMGEENIKMLEEELDMVIYRGENPPNMEDITVLMSPVVLVETNVPGDIAFPGMPFNDAYIRMHNYNSEEYSIQFDRGQDSDPEPHFGEGSFIIGEGNNFTVFGPQESEYENGTVLSMNVFSGTLTDDGIADTYYALIMLDNAEDPTLIPNDTGRSFEDSDQFSESTEWPYEDKHTTDQQHSTYPSFMELK